MVAAATLFVAIGSRQCACRKCQKTTKGIQCTKAPCAF
jgi:hypothetical protein